MQQPAQPLNQWLVAYIEQHRQTQSRYAIDKHLIQAGYNPVEIEAVWQSIIQKRANNILRHKPMRKPFFKSRNMWTIVGVIGLIAGIIWLLGPEFGYIYSNPDQMLNRAKIGDTASIRTFDSGIGCGKKTEEGTECFWRASAPDSGIKILFPAKKSISPDFGARVYWDVVVLSRENNILITEIKGVSTPMS